MQDKKHGTHHHRKEEMEHHKMREHHKAAHHAKKSAHHSSGHSKMISNERVNDNHQKGIERVKQRHGDMEVGQHGKMGMHHGSDSFKRSGGKMTPVRA